MELVPGQSRIGNYLMLERIADSGFADVWVGMHEVIELKVAIKVIAKTTFDSHNMKTRFNREVSLLKQTSHPFVALFFESIETETHHFLVMEYAENGNMGEFLTSKGPLTEPQARHYFSQLISVLEYLHNDKFVAHRDLKAENVLLDRHNNIRVIDFDLSTTFSASQANLNTACGSPAYAAPEMIKGQPYTQAADIWSAGVLLYSMVAGHLPYVDDNIQRLLQKIVYTDVHYPGFMSPPLIDLLRKMLSKNPETRLTLERIKEHHWFSQTEYAALIREQFVEWSNTEGVIDKEIVDKMTALGMDCRSLHEQILVGEFTELTSIYRQLIRQKGTDKMKDLMTTLQNSAGQAQQQVTGSRFAFGQRGAEQGAHKVTFGMAGASRFGQAGPEFIQTPPRANTSSSGSQTRIGGSTTAQSPRLPARSGSMKLQVPGQVQGAARRLSRPVAIRRGIDIPKKNQAHESP